MLTSEMRLSKPFRSPLCVTSSSSSLRGEGKEGKGGREKGREEEGERKAGGREGEGEGRE